MEVTAAPSATALKTIAELVPRAAASLRRSHRRSL